jgi:hypothetical protein
VLTILTRLGQKIKVNIILLLIFLGVFVGARLPNPYHSVNTTYYKPCQPPLKMGDYFKQWVLKRQEEIEKDSVYPVFLVNVYGGGIRGAAFTSMALTYLDSVMLHDHHWHNKAFSHYTFSLSGASGGTIGAAIHCAYRQKFLDDPSAYKLETFYQFYQHDFLTPVLITDIGRDVWAATGLSAWDDRAVVQEKTWSMMSENYLHKTDLTVPFCSLWDTSLKSRYEVPLLFSNTLNVDDGLKGICAPVLLEKEDFPATIFINDRLDSLNAHRKVKDSVQNLSLITGAFLSARFPIISPSGKMGPGFHFMDGGGKDNSGASTSEQIFIALAKYMSPQSNQDSVFAGLAKRLRFYFVSIDNSPRKKADARTLVNNRFEPLSPLIGIVNSGIYGNAEAADSTVQFRYRSSALPYMGIQTNYFTIFPTGDTLKDGKGVNYIPVLPLGWQISPQALGRLQASFYDTHLDWGNDIGIKVIQQQWPY